MTRQMYWAFRMKHPDALRLGPLVFRDPVLLCGSLYFLLYFDASGFLRLACWRRSCTSAGTFWCIVRCCAAFRSLR